MPTDPTTEPLRFAYWVPGLDPAAVPDPADGLSYDDPVLTAAG